MEEKPPKVWSEPLLLKTYSNSCGNHTHTFKCEELTFYGFPNQPDFATVTITMNPREKIIDLKSLKIYLLQFRDKKMSYERILNTIYDDISNTLQPSYLRVVIDTQPRGGISSQLIKERDIEW
jgi:7-cyano-7-deazaguanine reductase